MYIETLKYSSQTYLVCLQVELFTFLIFSALWEVALYFHYLHLRLSPAPEDHNTSYLADQNAFGAGETLYQSRREILLRKSRDGKVSLSRSFG